jgi:hypothetical protein
VCLCPKVLAARVDGDEATGGPHPIHGVAARVARARLPPWADEATAAAAHAKGELNSPRLDPDGEEGTVWGGRPLLTTSSVRLGGAVLTCKERVD